MANQDATATAIKQRNTVWQPFETMNVNDQLFLVTLPQFFIVSLLCRLGKRSSEWSHLAQSTS